MLAEIPLEDYLTTLDAVADELLAAADLRRPPVEGPALAARLNLVVARDSRQAGRARLVRLPGGGRGTILVRPDPRPEREHWAVLHEIGEFAAERVFARLGVDPAEAAGNSREAVANALAARLLLPGRWFAADGQRCGWDLRKLKRIYRTASHEMIARRMLDCPPPVVVTVFDHGCQTWRRTNLPGRVPPLDPLEASCWQAVRRDRAACALVRPPLRVTGWAVHEPGWFREILRCQVDADGP